MHDCPTKFVFASSAPSSLRDNSDQPHSDRSDDLMVCELQNVLQPIQEDVSHEESLVGDATID